MTHSKPISKPEIMSPAGYWPELRAAIEAGADAVYFGLHRFTARAKVGFSLEELPEAMAALHERGVKGCVTFNTLVYDSEMREAARTLAGIALAGADSVIVQDWAAAKMAREIAPSMEVHGSTQMSITSAEGVEMARRLGVTRVVLARELSLDDVRAIRAATGCELEIFVHGALCVSYSGQCFSSEAWGGRSANRGQCAQACRLPYELIVDGAPRPLADARYLLSPGDLYTLPLIPEIVRAGVAALKIEGRYKDATYVALTTRAYREAVDAAVAGDATPPDARRELELEQAYSRGMGPYFVAGTNHQNVVRGRAPRHRGVLMGRVSHVGPQSVIVKPSEAHAIAPLKPGDGVVFDAADWRSPGEQEEGGRVYQVTARNAALELQFGNRAIDFTRIRAGDLLWRTSDAETLRAARKFVEAQTPLHKQAVSVHVVANVGEPPRAEWSVGGSRAARVTVQTAGNLAAASKQAITAQTLREQLGRLGNTPYELAELTLETSGAPFVAVSTLNQLRRKAVQALIEAQHGDMEIPVADPETVAGAAIPVAAAGEAAAGVRARMHLLVRSADQLDAAIESRPDSITLDYLEFYGLGESVERIRASGINARVASPRVLKPGEQRIVHFLLKLGAPILVRSAGLLEGLQQTSHPQLTGDFSLNAANGASAAILLGMGLERLAPTHDLNAQQITELARSAGAHRIEAIAYHHLPVFHTEHCVFCRFLSNGTSHEDCGHPCEKHQVSLKDENGRAHPVMADIGCRNTVFGAEAQEASSHLDAWLGAGIRDFRLEFVHETPEQVRQIAEAFRRALDGERDTRGLRRRVAEASPQGTTEGSLFVPLSALTAASLERR
jgi:putative protease